MIAQIKAGSSGQRKVGQYQINIAAWPSQSTKRDGTAVRLNHAIAIPIEHVRATPRERSSGSTTRTVPRLTLVAAGFRDGRKSDGERRVKNPEFRPEPKVLCIQATPMLSNGAKSAGEAKPCPLSGPLLKKWFEQAFLNFRRHPAAIVTNADAHKFRDARFRVLPDMGGLGMRTTGGVSRDGAFFRHRVARIFDEVRRNLFKHLGSPMIGSGVWTHKF